METNAAVENVKIGQMINLTRASGGMDEGYYLGKTEMKVKDSFEKCIAIGYPAHFKECVAPYREYDIPLSVVIIRLDTIKEIQIVEGDTMTARECYDALYEHGNGSLDILGNIYDKMTEETEEADVS